MATVVGQKGQVVIEKRIRDALGIQPGDTAVERVVGDRVEIQFFRGEHAASLRGVLEGSVEYRLADDAWDVAREHAWRVAACRAIDDDRSDSESPAEDREAERGP
mgnify:FL=1